MPERPRLPLPLAGQRIGTGEFHGNSLQAIWLDVLAIMNSNKAHIKTSQA